MTMTSRALAITLSILLSGCGPSKTEEKAPQSSAVAAPEPWAALPNEQWPQLVLTNAAKFKGHTPLVGASGFLVRSETGEILAATARHLLGKNGGVQPEVTIGRLDASIDSWMMYPRTRADHAIKILGSASLVTGSDDNDWVLLKVDGSPTHVHPLRLRRTPVKVGEKVHLVGVSYAEPGVAQKVYSGIVTSREFGKFFRYSIRPHVNIRGFSGAPVLDEKGWVVGLMTVWFEPKKEGDLDREAGGQDAAAAFEIMNVKK